MSDAEHTAVTVPHHPALDQVENCGLCGIADSHSRTRVNPRLNHRTILLQDDIRMLLVSEVTHSAVWSAEQPVTAMLG